MNATYTIRYAYPGAAAYRAATAWTKGLTPAAANAVMLVAAPMLGLAFVITLPLAGLAYVAWNLAKALVHRRAAILRVAKRIGLFFAAPFVGLAYLVAFPFVVTGMLAYRAVKAVRG